MKWVRGRGSNLLTSTDLNDWVVKQPSGPWVELLSEAATEFELETSGAETSADYFVEWLAEWAREARRRQRGLLLMTAHRAKGLEFRPRGRVRRRLGPGWTQRGLGCAAPPVLCGHDPRKADPCPGSLSRAAPAAGYPGGYPFCASPPGARRTSAGSAGASPESTDD